MTALTLAAPDIAAAFVSQWEGFSSGPYEDQGGIWTIGFGSTRDSGGRPVTRETPEVTRSAAEDLLERDLSAAIRAVDRAVSVALNENQKAALYSFTYNVGIGGFLGSTLLRLVNAGSDEAALEFEKWDHVGGMKSAGLLRRRVAERDLFLSI